MPLWRYSGRTPVRYCWKMSCRSSTNASASRAGRPRSGRTYRSLSLARNRSVSGRCQSLNEVFQWWGAGRVRLPGTSASTVVYSRYNLVEALAVTRPLCIERGDRDALRGHGPGDGGKRTQVRARQDQVNGSVPVDLRKPPASPARRGPPRSPRTTRRRLDGGHAPRRQVRPQAIPEQTAHPASLPLGMHPQLQVGRVPSRCRAITDDLPADVLADQAAGVVCPQPKAATYAPEVALLNTAPARPHDPERSTGELRSSCPIFPLPRPGGFVSARLVWSGAGSRPRARERMCRLPPHRWDRVSRAGRTGPARPHRVPDARRSRRRRYARAGEGRASESTLDGLPPSRPPAVNSTRYACPTPLPSRPPSLSTEIRQIVGGHVVICLPSGLVEPAVAQGRSFEIDLLAVRVAVARISSSTGISGSR